MIKTVTKTKREEKIEKNMPEWFVYKRLKCDAVVVYTVVGSGYGNSAAKSYYVTLLIE